jgi:two-component system, cell cycle sensor histidine kinase and response regulator CckA
MADLHPGDATESVLVVDDEPGMRVTIEAILEEAGIPTCVASTAREAVEAQNSVGPALAIVDYRLPDGTGLDLARQLKEADPDIAVVALTGHASLESAIAAVGVVDRYLTKPIEPEALIATVKDRLERRGLITENRRLVAELRAANLQLEARVERRTRQLTESEERFWSFVDLSPGAVLIVDATGMIVVANPGAEQLFGSTVGSLAGVPIAELVEEGEIPAAELLGQAAESPTLALDVRACRRDGSTFPASLMAARLTGDSGGPLAITVRDDTERQRVEDALRLAYEREREAARHLREADQAKDEFLATVSHELRTPLTAVIGFADLLIERDELDPGTRDDLLRRVSANATTIHRMVGRLLDFAQLEGGVRLRIGPAPLLDLVQACLEAHGQDLAHNHVEVDVEDSLTVLADADGFGHVLGNLLSNAAKFAPEGSEICVRSGRRPGAAVISVVDHGPGIAVDEHEAVFERFYRSRLQTPGQRGTGIGLAIATRYVALLGGEIWVESRPGEGATFSFSLPLAREGTSG